jgi:hypothetical protein
MRVALRRLQVLAAAAVTALGLAPASPVRAEPARTSYDIDYTGPAGLSNYCGFSILHHIDGTFTLLSVGSGPRAVEVDRFSGIDEFVNADTGTSIDARNGTVQYFYPDGIYVGAPATASFTGLGAQHASGYRQVAGRLVLAGTVVAVDQNGFGIVSFSGVAAWSGSDATISFDPQAMVDSWCAALSD